METINIFITIVTVIVAWGFASSAIFEAKAKVEAKAEAEAKKVKAKAKAKAKAEAKAKAKAEAKAEAKLNMFREELEARLKEEDNAASEYQYSRGLVNWGDEDRKTLEVITWVTRGEYTYKDTTILRIPE